MTLRAVCSGSLALVLVAASSGGTRAQESPLARGPYVTASVEGAYAVGRNPAALAYVPTYALSIVHARATGSSGGTYTEGSFAFAMRGVGLGVSVDVFADPNARGRASVAAAYAPTSAISFGARYGIGGPDTRDATLDVAILARPSPRWSLAVTGRSLLGPLGLARSSGDRARFGFHVAARPLRDERFTSELSFEVADDGVLSGSMYVALALPRLGRAFFLADTADLLGSGAAHLVAGLELRLGGLAAGSLVGSGDGLDSFGAFASLDGRLASGVVPRDQIVRAVIDHALSPRAFAEFVLAVERLRHDARVRALSLELRRSDVGLAEAQELRQLFVALRERGVATYCFLESPTGSEAYACAAADASYMDEAGTVDLVGPSTTVATYGAVLQALGVHADFVRREEYKSAPERFTRDEPSPESRAMSARLVDGAYARLVQDLAGDLGLSRPEVRSLIDRGPLTPEEAIAAGLVDAAADLHDRARTIERSLGESFDERDLGDRAASAVWGREAGVAVVVIEGSIVDGESVSLPFGLLRTSGADTLVPLLDALAEDDGVASVVLRVDSPGGSALASDRIYRAVERLSEHKPVLASLGAVAASGGYYVAAAADRIFVDPSTITGSIGVFYGKFDVAPLLERLDVGVASIERGAHAGARSPFRPFDADERARLEILVDATYGRFLDRVAEGRSMPRDVLVPLAGGRVHAGDAAVGHGLVDELGGVAAAVARARILGGLPEGAPTSVLPRAQTSVVERLLGLPPLAGALAGVDVLADRGEARAYCVAPYDEGLR